MLFFASFPVCSLEGCHPLIVLLLSGCGLLWLPAMKEALCGGILSSGSRAEQHHRGAATPPPLALLEGALLHCLWGKTSPS